MSNDYRRAKKTYSFFKQRPVIVQSDAPSGSDVDINSMKKTYGSNRVGGSITASIDPPLTSEVINTETSEDILTESGEALMTEAP